MNMMPMYALEQLVAERRRASEATAAGRRRYRRRKPRSDALTMADGAMA
jgi:hypothetical protein